MIDLPRHLAPWGPQLALFPREIALVLGPLVARLAGLVGSFALDAAGDGAPDGYDGITRRGPYERLLVSEWLLHEEIPDEFIRRVASAEHSFLRRMHRQEAAARRSVALFDAGIDQLGAPRIGQLAALVVLAGRAGRARCDFAWGLLQDPTRRLAREVTDASVLGLVRGRRARPTLPDDFAGWLAEPEIAAASELWLVGAEPAAAEAHKHRRGLALVLSDVVTPEAPRRLRVQATQPRAAHRREVVLDVPPGPAAVRLLRDPFGVAVAPRQTPVAEVDPRSAIVFSHDGRRFYVRGSAGGRAALIAFSLPNSPRDRPGAPGVFVLPPDHVALAVGRGRGQRTVVATQYGDGAIEVHTLSRRGFAAIRSERFGLADAHLGTRLPAADPAPPLRPLGASGSGAFCFVDAEDNLVELSGSQVTIRDSDAIGPSWALPNGLAYLAYLPDGLVVRSTIGEANAGAFLLRPWTEDNVTGRDETVLRLDAGRAASLLSWSSSGTMWIVHQHAQAVRIAVTPGDEVVGALSGVGGDRPGASAGPRLVVLDAERKCIRLAGPDGVDLDLTAPSPIAAAATSEAAGMLALVTESGEVAAYSFRTREWLLRVDGAVPP